MSDTTLGIEALKKSVKFALDLAKQFQTSGADGWGWTDSFSFIDELSQIPSIIKSGKETLAELHDLSDEERTELNTYIKEEFDLPNDRIEDIVEKSLAISLSIVALIGEFKK